MSTIVIMPGGFHPFHAGHMSLYNAARKAFPDAEVYVAATNSQEERPFPFAVKEKLAKVAGVQPGHFIQVKSPFQSKEITQHYNPDQDVLIFVRSEKDRNESPKPGGMKKDGTPAYFQPYDAKNLQPFGKHAYFAYLPTVKFGPGITSATEIRKAWPTLDDRRKTAMVMSLYPATQKKPELANVVVKMLDQVMGSGLSEGEVIPFSRKQLTWQQLPKDVLKLANDWYWASMDDSGLDAVLDPKGYGSGTRNDLQYITAQLQQRGWYIDFNDEHDGPGEFNLILKNKNGQQLLLSIEDAQSFRGWAQGTNSDLKEQGVAEGDENQYRRPTPIEASKISQQTNAKLNPVASKFVWKKPNQIGGSFSEQDLVSKGFKKSQYNSWGGTQAMWDRLLSIKEDDMAEARVLFTDPNTKVNVYYYSRNPKYRGKPVQVGKAIPYNKIDAFINLIVSKYEVNPNELSWSDIRGDKTDAHIVHESLDYLEEK